MNIEIRAISKARRASQATYLAYRAALNEPPYIQDHKLQAYRRAAERECTLRNAYWIEHGCEPLL